MDLGWRAQSGILGRKATPIEGVGPTFAVGLGALVSAKKEEADLAAEQGIKLDREPRRKGVAFLFEKQNAGVAGRNQRDVQELKTEVNVLAESQKKLEEKAELYDKFQRGELQYDEEESNVDFLMKEREEGKLGRSSGDIAGPSLPKRGVGATSTSGLEDQQNRMGEQWASNNEAEWSMYQQEKQERKARDQAIKESEAISDLFEEERASAERKKRQRAAAKQKDLERAKQKALMSLLQKKQKVVK